MVTSSDDDTINYYDVEKAEYIQELYIQEEEHLQEQDLWSGPCEVHSSPYVHFVFINP